MKEKNKKPYKDCKPSVALVDDYDSNSNAESGHEKEAEIAVAKMNLDKPYVCQVLRPTRVK